MGSWSLKVLFNLLLEESSLEKNRDVQCQQDGVDIPSGSASIVALQAKKTVHLQDPYTRCTTENKEYQSMVKILANDTDVVKYLTNKDGGDFFTYNSQHCR